MTKPYWRARVLVQANPHTIPYTLCVIGDTRAKALRALRRRIKELRESGEPSHTYEDTLSTSQH